MKIENKLYLQYVKTLSIIEIAYRLGAKNFVLNNLLASR